MVWDDLYTLFSRSEGKTDIQALSLALLQLFKGQTAIS